MTITGQISTNETRYRTEDLQALVDFCLTHAKSNYGTRPKEFHFFEFRPRPTERPKSFRVSAFRLGAHSYGPEFIESKIRYVKTQRDQPGVVWIASPECWMDALAQLATSDDGQEVLLPRAAVQLLADAIKGSWHFQNVPADLTLSVHVALTSKTKRVRASQTRVIKVNKYIAMSGATIEGMNRLVRELNELVSVRHKLRDLSGQIGIRDPLAEGNLVDRTFRMKEELQSATEAIAASLAQINGTKEQT
jgi:hypothetical protein